MDNVQQERWALINKACESILNSVQGTVKDFFEFPQAHPGDDFVVIHQRMLFMTSVERDLSHIYRQARDLRRQVELTLSQLKSDLEDAKMEAVRQPTFKSLTSFDSRPVVDARLRSMTIELTHAVTQWEQLLKNVLYVQDVVYSHQQDASKERRDIDTRMKILQMQF